MAITVTNAELPIQWLDGATRTWVTSVAAELSDSNFVDPIERQSRPLLQFEFDVLPEDAADYEAFYIYHNGPARAFKVKPPVERDHLTTGKSLGVATGSSQNIQLTVTKVVGVFSTSWNADYVDEDTLHVYANGVEILTWSLGANGLLTVTATNGHVLTADYEWWTPMHFVDDEFETELKAGVATIEVPQSVIIREVFIA